MAVRAPRKPAPPRFEFRVFPDSASLAEAAAREFASAAGEAISSRGAFRVALSGGSTPRLLHATLAREPFASRIEWARGRFFFGDERCVPPEHERSNYRMAKETLFDPLGIAADKVFRMRGEEEPRRAALEYERLLRSEFRAHRRPRFDLVLLGMGPDGHTASLFPGSPALAEARRNVAANRVEAAHEWRLTLTFPALNGTRRAVFLVAGAEKRAPAARVLKGAPGAEELPAARVRPRRGSLLWLLDQAAGSGL